MSDQRLQGRVAVITGASSGIGEASVTAARVGFESASQFSREYARLRCAEARSCACVVTNRTVCLR